MGVAVALVIDETPLDDIVEGELDGSLGDVEEGRREPPVVTQKAFFSEDLPHPVDD